MIPTGCSKTNSRRVRFQHNFRLDRPPSLTQLPCRHVFGHCRPSTTTAPTCRNTPVTLVVTLVVTTAAGRTGPACVFRKTPGAPLVLSACGGCCTGELKPAVIADSTWYYWVLGFIAVAAVAGVLFTRKEMVLGVFSGCCGKKAKGDGLDGYIGAPETAGSTAAAGKAAPQGKAAFICSKTVPFIGPLPPQPTRPAPVTASTAERASALASTALASAALAALMGLESIIVLRWAVGTVVGQIST